MRGWFGSVRVYQTLTLPLYLPRAPQRPEKQAPPLVCLTMRRERSASSFLNHIEPTRNLRACSSIHTTSWRHITSWSLSARAACTRTSACRGEGAHAQVLHQRPHGSGQMERTCKLVDEKIYMLVPDNTHKTDREDIQVGGKRDGSVGMLKSLIFVRVQTTGPRRLLVGNHSQVGAGRARQEALDIVGHNHLPPHSTPPIQRHLSPSPPANITEDAPQQTGGMRAPLMQQTRIRALLNV